MKKNSTIITFIFLLALSSIVYLLQLTIFNTPRDTFFGLMQDLAFLPISVALVTIALSKMIEEREKRERLNKTNKLLSVFFSEFGIDLMRQLISCVSNMEEIASHLNIKAEWSSRNYDETIDVLKSLKIKVESKRICLVELKEMLGKKRGILIVILSNPALLEHEAFTDMIWAIFHLSDELLARERLDSLPNSDIGHLNNDIERAFRAILIHWVGYMKHVKKCYPYLFSLELRRNPFNKDAQIIVK